MTLDSIKIKNFKAVRDSGAVKLGPLTALVGNNGSGKSSLIEALETYQAIVADGLDVAMQRFMGIEHVQNKRAKPDTPISFDLRVRETFGKTHLGMSVGSDASRGAYAITNEVVKCNGQLVLEKHSDQEKEFYMTRWHTGFSMLQKSVHMLHYAELVESWQFLTLAPERMGFPLPQKRTGGRVRLARDGSNVAEFLVELRERDPRVLEGIIRTMTYVLPYARDLQPAITSELERKAWLQLTEGEFKVPGWMLSTGTLRVLALLALLRHPTPPPLLVIEEIENGLDPRSIHLLVEEIRRAVLAGTTQVVLTTHSPYLLDLLKLDQLVLVTRDEAGEPRFYRPASSAKLVEWAKEFAPGRLYTMGSLHEAAQ
jgi:predicted ATPase